MGEITEPCGTPAFVEKDSDDIPSATTLILRFVRGFGGAMVACWTIVPKIVGSNPAEAFGFFLSVKKSFSMPSFRMGK